MDKVAAAESRYLEFLKPTIGAQAIVRPHAIDAHCLCAGKTKQSGLSLSSEDMAKNITITRRRSSRLK